jgi:hypothetical protein
MTRALLLVCAGCESAYTPTAALATSEALRTNSDNAKTDAQTPQAQKGK